MIIDVRYLAMHLTRIYKPWLLTRVRPLSEAVSRGVRGYYIRMRDNPRK